MRILVMSDSHGNARNVSYAIEQENTAEYIVHLGDGERDMEPHLWAYPNKTVIQISGNCDFCSMNPSSQLFICEGRRIFATHGHPYYVKSGLTSLYFAAKEKNADIALFGHTHIAHLEIYNGITFLNPGSLADGSYATIDITPKGIECVHRKLRYY
ncbi:MAG: YfcE family phosphodiesterase [Acutalibacteraceae bacterium]